jgi:hypothetical protein
MAEISRLAEMNDTTFISVIGVSPVVLSDQAIQHYRFFRSSV